MLKLVNVSKYYSSNNVIALGLRKVNLEFRSNEFVAIVGESGSGKTTLLNVICGIDTYEEGEIYLNGEETSYFTVSDMENFRKKYVAFVFQNYNLIDSYTVLQNVEAPLVLAGYPKREIRSRAMEIIRRVGLEKHIHHKATKLSGGQKQRVVIARALAKNAPIIAADEPTGNLDSASAKQIVELLHEIAVDKLVIVVTHDYEQVKDYATRKIRIFDGEIVEDVEVAPAAKKDLPRIPDAESKLSLRDYLAIAVRNLLAVPKKSILMVVIFTVFSFFVALAYGAFNASMRDFENFGNQYFYNTSITRIVVRKTDKSAFTEADLAELLDDSAVKSYIAADYLLDTTLYMISSEMNEYGYYDSIYPYPVPASILEEDMLVAGRMPASDDEVVLAVSEGNVTYYVDGYLDTVLSTGSTRNWGEPTEDTVRVVGIAASASLHLSSTYENDFILLSDAAFAEIARVIYVSSGIVSGTFTGIDNLDDDFYAQEVFGGLALVLDDDVPDGTILYPYYDDCNPAFDVCEATGTLVVTDFYATRSVPGITYKYETIDQGDYSYQLTMSNATFDMLFGDDIHQVSVFAASDVGVDALVRRLGTIREDLTGFKYKVFYPYDSQSAEEYMQFFIMLNILGAAVTFAFTLLAATLITYIIFRAIINTKMHDYAIYRTIGASQKMIKTFIYLENVLTATIAYLIVLGSMIAMSGNVEFLTPILKFYTAGTYVVLFAILIVMAVLISSKYCRRVFRESVHRTLKSE